MPYPMRTAIALLRSGGSFAEAEALTRIPADEIMKAWASLTSVDTSVSISQPVPSAALPLQRDSASNG